VIKISQPRKLTIGMCCIQDYQGAYFTIQSILLYHSEVLADIEFVVVDNDPESIQGKALANFCQKWVKKVPIRYFPFSEYRATSLRNLVFDYAKTEYVLCCDSHVLFAPKAIQSLIGFFDTGLDKGGLIHGPLLYDDLKNAATHFSQDWSQGMWGQWKTDERLEKESYFEIPSQGMGAFACRKQAWLRFCDDNRGFGGEEGTIQELFRKNNRKVLCLVSFKWVHRFRYEGEHIPYPVSIEDKFKNHIREFNRLERNDQEIISHFTTLDVEESTLFEWKKQTLNLQENEA